MGRLRTERISGTDRGRCRHALVDGRNVPRYSPAPRNARYSDTRLVGLGTRVQVIQRADGIPHFGSRRRVSQGEPVPHIQIMDTVVDSRHLAEFKRVKDQTAVAVGGKPCSAVLVIRFCP